MQHYSRQVERSQLQIDQLSARTLSYEASMIALETFWEQVIIFLAILFTLLILSPLYWRVWLTCRSFLQLVQQMRLLVKPNSLPSEIQESG